MVVVEKNNITLGDLLYAVYGVSNMTKLKNMDFSESLDYLKEGHLLSREGWNGKNMYIALQKGYPNGIPINKNTAEALHLPEGTVCRFLPYIMMKTADDTLVPWIASQSDILANDWGVIE